MKNFLVHCLFILIVAPAFSQIIAPDRKSDWHSAGHVKPLPEYDITFNINDFGGAGDSIVLNETAFEAAVLALQGRAGIIYFPAGKYLFHNSIRLLDSVIVRGAGAELTTFYFDLAGASKDCVVAHGTAESDALSTMLTQTVVLGDTLLWVATSAQFQPGDFLKLQFDDSLVVTSAWARGSVGQLFDVLETSNIGWLKVNHPLRFELPLSLHPRLTRISPVEEAGIECLKIKRLDATLGLTSNISFLYARRCWIVGVESQSCNFAHLALDGSAHCEVYGSYFHEAFAYGGGGQGYGIACEFTSSDNRVQSGIFRHLRHSLLLQSGATGNVFGYNYSTDPTWVEIPNDGAGELVLHGNYPSYNLFEGNVCKNIRPDGSHGANGPFNTFFRNRSTGYGFITTGTQANFNVLGNEIVSGGLFQGLYLVTGTNHFEYGNNVGGTITPVGTNGVMDTSLYFNGLPNFLSEANFLMGPPKALNTAVIPAQQRFLSGVEKTDCTARSGLFVAAPIPSETQEVAWNIFPNPASTHLNILAKEPVMIEVYDLSGKLWFRNIAPAFALNIPCEKWPSGVYVARSKSNSALLLKN